MLRFQKITVALMGAALAITAATAASAETAWQEHHPRRVEVTHRLANQNRRITMERREGELTRAQAHSLRSQDRAIRAEERAYASEHGSHITRAEQRQLNGQLNTVSREIAR